MTTVNCGGTPWAKMRDKCSGLIPTPVSCTCRHTKPSRPAGIPAPMLNRCGRSDNSSMAYLALLIRLTKIRSTRCLSSTMRGISAYSRMTSI
jgi:hypothetical protein